MCYFIILQGCAVTCITVMGWDSRTRNEGRQRAARAWVAAWEQHTPPRVAFRRHGGRCALQLAAPVLQGGKAQSRKHQTHHTGQRLGRWGYSVGGVTGDLAPRPGFRSEIQRRRRREPCEYLRKESSGPRASGTHMALRQDRAQGAWRPLGRRFMPFKAVNREGSRSGRLCRAQGQQRRRRDLDGGWQGVGLGERQGAAVGVRTHPWEATSF